MSDDRQTLTLGSTSDDAVHPVLVVIKTGTDIQTKLWRGGPLLVGTGADATLRLGDAAVSRRHFEAELHPGRVRVKDLRSRNGTRYLGARIETAMIPVGGSVLVGQTTIRFLAAVSPVRHDDEAGIFWGLVGRSPAALALFSLIERLAQQTTSVLIRGETGSGKGSVARAIHEAAGGATRPFIVFDCASVNANLVESDLFGHVKGAFTGASSEREGAIEAADGGTLFLDEIGDLPADAQGRLLRVLETREFRRVGGKDFQHSHFRLIAATHRDLAAMTRQGRFRTDLLHRLLVAELIVPPLRDRREDIPLLVRHFARQLGVPERILKTDWIADLQTRPWTGNVRELRNAVERHLMVAAAQTLEEVGVPSFAEARSVVLDRFEREYLKSLLERNRGNASAAAREAQMARSQFYRLLVRHKLRSTED